MSWIQFALVSQILYRVGVVRFFSGVGKLLLGFWVVFMATVFVDLSADFFAFVLGYLSIYGSRAVTAVALVVGCLYWFHRDGQRNDRFFNEFAGGTLFSLYSLKSVAGFSMITVAFAIEPVSILLVVVAAVWLLWRYDWVGRPHGIVMLAALLGLFTIPNGVSPMDSMSLSISLTMAAVAANRYSPNKSGWSRGHPKWIWKFDWRERLRRPVEPHPDYDGDVILDVYPDEIEEDDNSSGNDLPHQQNGGETESDRDPRGANQSEPTTNNTPTRSQTSQDGANSRRDVTDQSNREEADTDAKPIEAMHIENQNPGQNQQEREQTVLEELEFDWEKPPENRFENIGGYDDVKEKLTEDVVLPVRDSNPGFDRYGIEPTRGVLFYGPPGTGKTMFARALANELNKPFVELSQADLTSEYINEGAQLVSTVFEEAQALEGVVFIDEAEQLLSQRGSRNQHNEDQKVMNTFLSALSRDDQQFIVILTTNRKDLIDDAVLRSGRVDREIRIGLPDKEARLEILKTKLADIPHGLSTTDLQQFVIETVEWSGADLDSLIGNARRKAAIENAPELRQDHIDLNSVDRA